MLPQLLHEHHIGSYFSSKFGACAYYEYRKLSDCIRPGPGNTFVLLDEGLSSNDAWCMADMGGDDPRNPAQQVGFGGDSPGA